MTKPLDFIKQTLQGKSIYRVLFNWQVEKCSSKITGKVLDIASGQNASYNVYLSGQTEIIRVDSIQNAESFIDFNKKFPFQDNSFDSVLLFNALYIANDPVFTIREIHRVLKNGGQLFLASPFVANEMPEPSDFARFTKEGLEKLLRDAGFSRFETERFGERFTSGAYLVHPLLVFNFFRLLVNGLCLVLDKLIPTRIREKYPVPIGYFSIAIKS